MSEQIIQQDNKKIEVPSIVRGYSFFLLLDGIFSLLAAVPLLLLGGLGVIIGGIGILKIIVASGLRKMKKWALYLFTLVGIAGIIMLIIGQKDIVSILIIALELVFLIYFWSIQEKFVK